MCPLGREARGLGTSKGIENLSRDSSTAGSLVRFIVDFARDAPERDCRVSEGLRDFGCLPGAWEWELEGDDESFWYFFEASHGLREAGAFAVLRGPRA